MQSKALSVEDYINEIPEIQREQIMQLRKAILENIPAGFAEEMSYGMIGYVVPHNIYPKGYHCNTKLPLPFLNIAAQKNFVAVYHMGIYANPELMEWFTTEFPKHSNLKLEMGKSCMRFKNRSQIPCTLIGELVQKIEVADWISLYESTFLNNKTD